MKVLLINGGPHADGSTNRALDEIIEVLNSEGIETEKIQVGNLDVHGCLACGFCHENGRCVFDDVVNEAAAKMAECDGLIVGTPVHYASPSGAVISFLDRLFYSTRSDLFAGKPAAAVVSARRAGTTSSFEVINKYFTISSMPVISANYWNEVYGNNKHQTEQDEEGLRTMRNLARNMAFVLKAFDLAKKQGISFPEQEKGKSTNFIR